MFVIKGLEYLGRNVVVRGKEKNLEAKKFVTLAETDKEPTKDDVIKAASENSKVKRAWVMEMNGNKWKKIGDTISVNS